jgi:hypothetical protein
MPDIFGREVSDYQHLQRIQANNMLDAHFSQLRARGRDHNFNALPTITNPVQVPVNDIEAQAQALSFVTNNFQAIQAQIEEILYTDFRLDEWVPIITNVPEGAKSYSYRVMNKYGRGKFIDNPGKSANPATVSLQNVPYGLSYGGIIPSWSIEDLRNAAFAGISLDTETIQAGTEGCMDHIEIIGLSGDTAEGFTGLINNASVSVSSSLKTIANMTADEMVAFVQGLATNLISSSEEVFGRTLKQGATLYLPVAQAGLIKNTKLADDASKSVWDYVSTQNLWTEYTGNPLKMAIVAELKDAGVGPSDRAIFGLNNDRVMEMAMPFAPRAINTIQVSYGVEVPMEYKISGLNVKRPGGLAYIDDI